jgi:hypothetical protein
VTTCPVSEHRKERVTACRDPRAGFEGLEVGSKCTGVGVAPLGVGVEGLVQDDREVLVDSGAPKHAVALAEVGGWDSVEGAELPEHCANGEDVSTPVDVLAAFLLRGHVGGGAEDSSGGSEVLVVWGAQRAPAGHRLVAGRQVLGQAPVDHDRLAKIAHDYVSGLEIAVDDVEPVRVGDGIGDSDDVMEEANALVDGCTRGDQVTERAARYKLHGIVGCAVGPAPSLVNRNDAWMLETRGDHGLAQEAQLGDRGA